MKNSNKNNQLYALEESIYLPDFIHIQKNMYVTFRTHIPAQFLHIPPNKQYYLNICCSSDK